MNEFDLLYRELLMIAIILAFVSFIILMLAVYFAWQLHIELKKNKKEKIHADRKLGDFISFNKQFD